MGSVTRQKFLAKRPRRKVRVDLPEVGEGEYLIVRAMSALERGRFEASLTKSDGTPDINKLSQTRELMALACCVDDDGNKLFTDGDLEALGDVELSVLDRIVKASQDLHDPNAESVAALEKKSEPPRSGDSPSVSPGTSAG